MPVILVVDGDARYRGLVKEMILRRHPEMAVDEAHSRQDALQLARRRHPDVIITEIDMRGKRTMNLPGELAAVHPDGTIVVLTSCDQSEYREAVLHSGAHHFISKSLPHRHRLLNIVEAALEPQGGGESAFTR